MQRTERDRTTRLGGSENIRARIERRKPGIWDLREWLWELEDTPPTERNNFWQGQTETLRAEIDLRIERGEDDQ